MIIAISMLKTFFRYTIFAILIATLFARCATIGAPGGGPRDSIPPILIGTHPVPYAVNFDGKKVILAFNEYVQLKEQSKLFFMSPPATKKPLLTVKGKNVVIEFQEPLDSNATYRLDFGSSIVDNNEGNKLDGFSFVFSTGPYIDSLLMAGQTLNAQTRDTVIGSYLFYFDRSTDSTTLDSVMFKSRAEALFRSDSSGYFIADILKDKDYRLYALGDDNGNQQYEAGTDMIGFLDSVYNPSTLPPFEMGYDSIKRRWEITPPQVIFELFKEIPVKRQTLLEHKRPSKQQLTIVFNAPETRIDTLRFDSIPDQWLMKHWNPTRDSLTMWISPPTLEALENLPDTLVARIAFQKHDSVWNYYTHGQNLSFNFKSAKPKLTKAEERAEKQVKQKVKKEKKVKKPKKVRKSRRKSNPVADSMKMVRRAAADSTAKSQLPKADSVKKENPFKFTVSARKEFVPLGDMTFDFEIPLSTVDTKRISLQHIPTVTRKGKAQLADKGRPMPFEFIQDTTSLTRWKLKAKWTRGDNYQLLIPDKVFQNIAFQANDTLKADFTAVLPDKFGTTTLTITPDTLYNQSYIIQLTQGRDKNEKIIRNIKLSPADFKEPIDIEYLPAGSYRLRIIEDRNNNGTWDTGSLTLRQHPERVRLWRAANGSTEVVSKENWQVPITINMSELFSKP